MDGQSPEAPKKILSKGHHRHTSSQRPVVPRRSTKGPLDVADDPLSVTIADVDRSPTHDLAGTISPPPLSASRSNSRSPAPPSPLPPPSPAVHPIPVTALSHLLRPSLFRPLPPAPIAYLPPPNTSISNLLAAGQFRAAALLSARHLASPPNPMAPLTTPAIFELWHVRLAMLCLLGLEHVAAEESRALGDVVDAPVYVNPETGESDLPWALRVLAVRLQARAEGDIGRAVTSYYSLAREGRRRAKKESEEVWEPRLKDLEVRVASLLVEMGDLDGAVRMLESVYTRARAASGDSDSDDEGLAAGRLALVYLQIGNVQRAHSIVNEATAEGRETYASTLQSLVEAADGNFESIAMSIDQDRLSKDSFLMQNLAVFLMYSGRLPEAKQTLTQLIEQRSEAFPTLLFNLATMFELSTDKARQLKLDLGKGLLERQDVTLGIESSVADLKL